MDTQKFEFATKEEAENWIDGDFYGSMSDSYPDYTIKEIYAINDMWYVEIIKE